MRSVVNFSVLTVLTVAVIFVNLGGFPLLDPDEPVYAETPKEMILYDDFISPQIYGQFWYDKPPMYYWLVAGAFKLLGINEYAARFPSAVLAVFCVLLVYGVVGKLFSERAALVSGLVLATSIEYFYVGKAAVTDITLTFCLTGALLFFLGKQYYLFYIFAALATLTKGPIGFLFPGAIIFIWLAVTRGLGELHRMKIPAGVVIFLAVALPWYWLMYKIHGAAFIDGFIGVNNITRFTTAEHAKTAVWYFFIPVLIAGFFPWISLLPQAVKTVFRAKGTSHYPALLFLVIWAVFIFVFFSISSTKLITYILPVFPPLAILVGWALDRLWGDYRPTGWGLAWPLLLSALGLLIIGGAIFGIRQFPAVITGAIALSAIIIGMICLTWRFLLKKDVAKAFWTQTIGMVMVSIVLVTLLVPPVADGLSSRGIASKFTTYNDGKTPVYVIKFLHPGFAFYSGVYGNEVKTTEDLRNVICENKPAFFVIRQADYTRLTEPERKSLDTLAQSDEKLLLKYAPGAP
jgi:4-amino-4-deoxy-L-arabinose transferase-like glycosyltransferase